MSSMRYWKVGLFFLAAFFMQTTLLNVISIYGYTPNLLLSMVILFTFLYEQELYGIVYGALFGVLYDVIYSNVIGPTPISLVMVAAGILVVREYTNIENIINMWVVSAASIVAYYFMNWGLYHMAGNPAGLAIVFAKVPWIALYSLVFITILYRILIRKMNVHHKDRYFK
ncbi:MAG: rod shape-determining protein MreD [Firmicutes bacterium]|nr:rod shape-determining protein MreD [Bacillota bacterium]